MLFPLDVLGLSFHFTLFWTFKVEWKTWEDISIYIYIYIYIYILIIFHYIPDNISLSSYLQWKKRSTKRDKNSPIWEIFLPAKSIPIYKFTQTFFSVRRSAKFLTYTSIVFHSGKVCDQLLIYYESENSRF